VISRNDFPAHLFSNRNHSTLGNFPKFHNDRSTSVAAVLKPPELIMFLESVDDAQVSVIIEISNVAAMMMPAMGYARRSSAADQDNS
jgi:hypothetical protein